EPERETVLDDAADERGRFARGKSLLRLAGELRVLEFCTEDEVEPVPHVFRGNLYAARQQAAELAIFAQRRRKAGAHAVYVRAILRRRDQVDIAFADLRRLCRPDESPFHALVLAGKAARE